MATDDALPLCRADARAGHRESRIREADALLDPGDPYVHLGDLESYLVAQQRVSWLWRDPGAWGRKAVLNVARMGRFSSDRTIREYARDVWGLRVAAVPRTAPVRA